MKWIQARGKSEANPPGSQAEPTPTRTKGRRRLSEACLYAQLPRQRHPWSMCWCGLAYTCTQAFRVHHAADRRELAAGMELVPGLLDARFVAWDVDVGYRCVILGGSWRLGVETCTEAGWRPATPWQLDDLGWHSFYHSVRSEGTYIVAGRSRMLCSADWQYCLTLSASAIIGFRGGWRWNSNQAWMRQY